MATVHRGASPERTIKPKILIATTCRWFSAARVAMSFADTGCTVEAVCPPDHPLLLTRRIQQTYSYHGLTSAHSLRAAIGLSQADLIVPCDELAALLLHHLYRQALQSESEASQHLRAAIERSLGDPASFSLIESRNRFLSLAAEEGIPIPQTTVVESVQDVKRWLAQNPLPAVLKADGTSGGEGVMIVESADHASRAFRRLKAPLSTPVVAKRTLVDRDPNLIGPWLRRRERNVSIQPYIPGRDANIAVACWQGRVLASVSIEVLRSGISKGPAALVRILPDGDMLRATERIVDRLGISGLCGLDFMIHEETGIPHLIEINARATQTGHLPLGPGHDLQAALTAVLTGEPVKEREPMIQKDIVALFPLAWQTEPDSLLIRTGYHDVPWEEPRLVRAGMKKEHPLNYPNLIRLWSKFWQSGSKSAEGEP
jgi:hypothetical protein